MEIINKVLLKVDEDDLLDDILVLEDVIEIGTDVFKNNPHVKVVDAPALRAVGNNAFRECPFFTELKAPLLETIGDYAFFKDDKLASFDFTNVKTIERGAFEGCALNQIDLTKNVEKIGSSAFANNPYLVKVLLQVSASKIKDSTFENCSNLKEVLLADGINKIGISAFKNCRKLSNLILPEHLNVIETNAFWGCEALKKVIFNLNLKFIGDYAFGNTKISEAILPANLKNIGKLPFHMCYQLEKVALPQIFHNDIFDKTASKLKEIILANEKVEVLKPIKRILNHNNLVIIRYNDDAFQILAQPFKYYDQVYLDNLFPGSNTKLIMKHDEIYNIFYWETILDLNELKKLNPLVIIALPPNINMIKALSKKWSVYEEIIKANNITDFTSIIAAIKFITIFGGLCRKSNYNIAKMFAKIGIRQIVKGFLNVEVKEFNQNFVNLYLKLNEVYSFKEINTVMPFLYNNIEKVINLENNFVLDTISAVSYNESELHECANFEVIKSTKNYPNYEWLDTPDIINQLWGYILGSVANRNIDTNEQSRKFLTYYIKDENNLIVASSRAYYSVSEKYLLFNSIILFPSFINKKYSVEEIKRRIIDYVLVKIEEPINFLNSSEEVVTKVNVGISEKSISEQILNKGTKIIIQNL